MVISVLEHSATHSAKYAVDRHTSGNESVEVACIAFSAHSEFKDIFFRVTNFNRT